MANFLESAKAKAERLASDDVVSDDTTPLFQNSLDYIHKKEDAIDILLLSEANIGDPIRVIYGSAYEDGTLVGIENRKLVIEMRNGFQRRVPPWLCIAL